MPWEEHIVYPLRNLDNPLPRDMPWDQIVSNPLSLKNDVLKDACRSIYEQVSGTKAVLILRLLKHFGIERPCAVPPIVLLAVKHEKVSYACTQLNQSHEVALAVGHAFCQITGTHIHCGDTTMYAVRRALASQFESNPQLLQFARSLIASQIFCRAHTGGKTRKITECRTNRAAGRCGCGNQPAPTCQQACCKTCCLGPCARHTR